MSSPQKHLQIVKQLERMILAGEFKPGERLPAERELMKGFDASYMTFRKAMLELCARGLLERRGRNGSFLNRNALSIIGLKKTHFVYRTWEGPFFEDLQKLAIKAIERCGRIPSIVHFQDGVGRHLTQALEQGESVILYGVDPGDFGSDFERMLKAAKSSRASIVALGLGLHADGIPRVKADDDAAMEMAVEHLRSKGHKRIMLCSPLSYMAQPFYERLAPWFDYVSEAGFMASRMDYFLGLGEWRELAELRDFIRLRLEARPKNATAMICLGNAELLGAMSACYKLGLEIPKDLSLLMLGDCSITEFLTPPVTAVSVDLERHMDLVMQIIMDHELHGGRQPELSLVSPKLIERESVALR